MYRLCLHTYLITSTGAHQAVSGTTKVELHIELYVVDDILAK